MRRWDAIEARFAKGWSPSAIDKALHLQPGSAKSHIIALWSKRGANLEGKPRGKPQALPYEKVRGVLEARGRLSADEAARCFGVSRTSVYCIWRGDIQPTRKEN